MSDVVVSSAVTRGEATGRDHHYRCLQLSLEGRDAEVDPLSGRCGERRKWDGRKVFVAIGAERVQERCKEWHWTEDASRLR